MKTIQISDITLTNRQRRHFDEKAITSLANSIQKKGLLHPVVLQNDAKTLVCGERRCRAISSIYELFTTITHDEQPVPEGSVPFITLGELSHDDLIEAELEENILREDLTWQEEADAIAKLHEIRVGAIPNQTYTDTAEEIMGDLATSNDKLAVRNAVIVAEHLNDPDVAKAKSTKEAIKIIAKKKQQELTNQLAKQFDITATPHILNNGDFRDFTHFIETGSVDCILTDPPYGINADQFGDMADATHGYTDSPEYFKEILADFITEASRVTRPAAHLYLFCDPRWVTHIQEALSASGWDVWPVPLIWNKGNGMLPRPDFGPRRTYETIIYAIKGDRTVNAVYPDVISIPGLQAPRYGAEKPVELYENLIKRSCKPGDLVWDAFAGAGPVFPAANRCSVKAVGTELSEDKFNFAKLRLEGE